MVPARMIATGPPRGETKEPAHPARPALPRLPKAPDLPSTTGAVAFIVNGGWPRPAWGTAPAVWEDSSDVDPRAGGVPDGGHRRPRLPLLLRLLRLLRL